MELTNEQYFLSKYIQGGNRTKNFLVRDCSINDILNFKKALLKYKNNSIVAVIYLSSLDEKAIHSMYKRINNEPALASFKEKVTIEEVANAYFLANIYNYILTHYDLDVIPENCNFENIKRVLTFNNKNRITPRDIIAILNMNNGESFENLAFDNRAFIDICIFELDISSRLLQECVNNCLAAPNNRTRTKVFTNLPDISTHLTTSRERVNPLEHYLVIRAENFVLPENNLLKK